MHDLLLPESSSRPVSRNQSPEQLFYAVGSSALGSVLVARSEKGICLISLGDGPQVLLDDLQTRFPKAHFLEGTNIMAKTLERVAEPCEEPTRRFRFPLDLRGTEFQKRVWEELRKIPAGQTRTYTDIARQIGRPQAVRAVAGACGANPLALVVPCHRVLRRDGALGGYRWGIERKKILLETEAKYSSL